MKNGKPAFFAEKLLEDENERQIARKSTFVKPVTNSQGDLDIRATMSATDCKQIDDMKDASQDLTIRPEIEELLWEESTTLLGLGSFEKTKQLFQSRAALMDGILKLQRAINLIELVIPVVAKVMDKDKRTDGVKILDTHIIQELLQRAKNSGKSAHKEVYSRLLTDLSSMYSDEAIEEMVDTIAWIRRHLKAATVTDENDAQSVSRSAQEMLGSLKQILFKVSNYQVSLLFKPSFPDTFPELPSSEAPARPSSPVNPSPVMKQAEDLETHISLLNKVTANLKPYRVMEDAPVYMSFNSHSSTYTVKAGQEVKLISNPGDGPRVKIIWTDTKDRWPTRCWIDAQKLSKLELKRARSLG